MAKPKTDSVTWMQNDGDVITLVNASSNNYVLDLPTGYFRLDAGRRMRTLRSITGIDQVQKLISAGHLRVEG